MQQLATPPSSNKTSTEDASILRLIELSANPRKKVLLLEDDPPFKDLLQNFLTESGYTVVAVTNGAEGAHQVLVSDFEIILCDLMMPALPGDLFYKAVERMRPHLCERFIFMTGYRDEPKLKDFLQTVHGTLLTKPFQVDDLLEMIGFIEVRRAVAAA